MFFFPQATLNFFSEHVLYGKDKLHNDSRFNLFSKVEKIHYASFFFGGGVGGGVVGTFHGP